MKKVFALLMVAVMSMGVVGCGSSQTESAAAPAETSSADTSADASADVEPLLLKVSFSETEDSIFGVEVLAAFEKITEETDGRLAFEYYPNNQLGSITDMLEQMQAGAPLICSLGFDNLGDTVASFAPASFPYIYNDLYEVQMLGNSDWMAAVETELLAQNVVPLCYGAIGYRHFISTFPIGSAADVSGHIMRMGPSSSAQGFITVMGGTPTTTTWADNYSLLQTGVIDACEAPLSLLLSSSLNEVCSDLCLSGHFVNPFSLCINPTYWDQISAEDQAVVTRLLDEACTNMADTAMEMEEQYIQDFKDAGVNVVSPDKATFAAYVPALFEELSLDPAIYDDIRAAIDANK
ncbi:TRAP transporter substrate-binding protein [Chakrabartyella piscis]|uniref:TRAP transporter substrate-binding protein n=1 Tax=Chakrabartyella piscis TaxID=2918914 RepID=UPI0029585091|nr:TRAP transporter substrate-binding protein [Chakrabartyella piscis]